MLAEFHRRATIQTDLTAWAESCGYKPAAHHKLILEKLQDVVAGRIKRLALFLPPGSAKSTYSSMLLPPWFLCRHPQGQILACSHNKDLAEKFGRVARNLVDEHHKVLGYKLAADSKAAGEWSTSKKGLFFCAGVLSKIAGHRADLALIDDPVGKKEDAESKDIRDKTWDWYNYDFIPRLKPDAGLVLIQTRWHEDDLAGRILLTEGEDWTVVCIPLIADTANDPLGRAIGDPLWPEYFTPKFIEDKKKSPAFISLYQQKPTPDSGEFFKVEWLDPYTYKDEADFPQDVKWYMGSDHACGTKEENDRNVIIPAGLDNQGDLWIHWDIWWPREANRPDTHRTAHEMIRMQRTFRSLSWFVGKEHIVASVLPFLNVMMKEERVYIPLVMSVSSKDKRTRATSFRDLCALGRVHFPRFAPWWPDARGELLRFDKGLHDDVVDGLSELGRGLDKMAAPIRPDQSLLPPPEEDKFRGLTIGWIRRSHAAREAREALAEDYAIDVEALVDAQSQD